jgi:hypothetical protein
MVIKVRNEDRKSWVFIDGVSMATLENNWCFVDDLDKQNILCAVMNSKDNTQKVETKGCGSSIDNKKIENSSKIEDYADNHGILWINTSVICPYDVDYRSSSVRQLVNKSNTNTIYRTSVLKITFFDERRDGAIILINNGSDCFLLNNEGKTIDRL